jgi:hypothetical protein
MSIHQNETSSFFFLTASASVPDKGFEQNDLPALIKNRASGENWCKPGRTGSNDFPLSFNAAANPSLSAMFSPSVSYIGHY